MSQKSKKITLIDNAKDKVSLEIIEEDQKAEEKRLDLKETIERIKKVKDLYLSKAINIGGKDYHTNPQLSSKDRYELEQISLFVEALESSLFYLENIQGKDKVKKFIQVMEKCKLSKSGTIWNEFHKIFEVK